MNVSIIKTISSLRSYCKDHSIQFKHLPSVINDPKVVPMIRGYAFEFDVFDKVKKLFSKTKRFYVEKHYMNAEIFHPDIDIKNLTVVDAKEIYKRDYWDKNKVDSVPDELKHIYFDCCVNMGISRAVKILQQSAVNKGKNIKVDGGMGPMTIGAMKGVELDRVRAYRVKYYEIGRAHV